MNGWAICVLLIVAAIVAILNFIGIIALSIMEFAIILLIAYFIIGFLSCADLESEKIISYAQFTSLSDKKKLLVGFGNKQKCVILKRDLYSDDD